MYISINIDTYKFRDGMVATQPSAKQAPPRVSHADVAWHSPSSSQVNLAFIMEPKVSNGLVACRQCAIEILRENEGVIVFARISMRNESRRLVFNTRYQLRRSMTMSDEEIIFE